MSVVDDRQTKIIYGAYKNMKYRCINPDSKHYKDYGGRGIRISDEWDTFEKFYQWSIENGHEEGLTLERVNNNGNYDPENCKWATTKEQGRNRRYNHEVTIDGVTKNAWDWCEEYDLNYSTFATRYHSYGWDIIRAITTPVQIRKKPSGHKNRHTKKVRQII